MNWEFPWCKLNCLLFFFPAKSNRKLTFLYLANDVIQNSKRKGPEFTREFESVLVDAFSHVARYVVSLFVLVLSTLPFLFFVLSFYKVTFVNWQLVLYRDVLYRVVQKLNYGFMFCWAIKNYLRHINILMHWGIQSSTWKILSLDVVICWIHFLNMVYFS